MRSDTSLIPIFNPNLGNVMSEMVCFAPQKPHLCDINYMIFYINGIFNPEIDKIEEEIIPLIKNIYSGLNKSFKVEVLHNNTTPNLPTLAQQVVRGDLEGDKRDSAFSPASKIVEYLKTFQNSVIIIGHSQGASIMDNVLESLRNYIDRVYVISIGGVHSIQNADNVCEFVHRMDFPALLARKYHFEKPRRSYYQISGKCLGLGCHSSHTYLTNDSVIKAIRSALIDISCRGDVESESATTS